jgi:hypothetical protein
MFLILGRAAGLRAAVLLIYLCDDRIAYGLQFLKLSL